MSVDILETSWDQCRSMIQYSFTSTETRRLVRTNSPGRPPRLSHSSWTMTLQVHPVKTVYLFSREIRCVSVLPKRKPAKVYQKDRQIYLLCFWISSDVTRHEVQAFSEMWPEWRGKTRSCGRFVHSVLLHQAAVGCYVPCRRLRNASSVTYYMLTRLCRQMTRLEVTLFVFWWLPFRPGSLWGDFTVPCDSSCGDPVRLTGRKNPQH